MNWLFQLVSPGLEPEGGDGGPWPSRSAGGSLSGAREAMELLGKISGKSIGNWENLWNIYGKLGKSLENWENLWKIYGKIGKIYGTCTEFSGKSMGHLGKSMEHLWKI